MERRMVVTQRECPALLVPVGTPISIPKDTFVTITQSLGGSFTIVHNGNMARVDGTDADALGMEPLTFDFPPPADGEVSTEQVQEVLQSVFDPEIPVNIVDLGLVYECVVKAGVISIKMTLTAPGCGMGPILVEDVKYRLAKVPHVKRIEVELVFDPPWAREMMSDEAKLELGMF